MLDYKKILIASVSLLLLLSLSVSFFPSSKSAALSGSEFNASRIIDDLLFYRASSMSATQIQNFLNSKVPTCDTWGTQMHWSGVTRAERGTSYGNPPPFTCLKDYRQNTPSKPSVSGQCSAVSAKSNQSAAQIIYDVSNACGIDSKVLIVMLQKEQSLITDDWPWAVQYDKAMGYYCPDDPSRPGWCHPDYAGFFNQVYNAAKQFKNYRQNPQLFNFAVNRTSKVYYQANNTSCGYTWITMQNAATAGLYNYTPYQPNAAALANLYGTGDACSAYGNRNFWRMYRDWFGSTDANDTLTAHPEGTLVNQDGKIYLIDGGTKHHIQNARIFLSYGYKWSQVKRASTGDRNLTTGTPVSTLAPGTLFTANGVVYVMDYDGATLKKRHVSYGSFMSLGYKWNEVLSIPANEVPAETFSTILTNDQHPSGSLIRFSGDAKVYLVEKGKRRHVINSFAFVSNNYGWDRVKAGTTQDAALPISTDTVEAREGTIALANGDIYVIGDDGSAYKRPVGPWECYANMLYYTSSDWISTSGSSLPARDGSRFTC